jgi:hypothetical protein
VCRNIFFFQKTKKPGKAFWHFFGANLFINIFFNSQRTLAFFFWTILSRHFNSNFQFSNSSFKNRAISSCVDVATNLNPWKINIEFRWHILSFFWLNTVFSKGAPQFLMSFHQHLVFSWEFTAFVRTKKRWCFTH